MRAIAELLNRDFVSIKVDREERPDVDRVYMSFVQATTGSGGWPMTVFLTPELKPFYGGTYFPPASRWGRPGFADLLGELARVWKDERAQVETAAGELLRAPALGRRRTSGRGGIARSRRRALDTAVEQFQMAFDRRRGGFGDAPKFPRPSELLFLLREHARRSAAGAAPQAPLLMATETLRAMALGGMRDHIGGGFHRYSVDGAWRVPHFEKMLYDQAQLVLAYLEAAQATGESFYAAVAEDTLAYVQRDMTDPDGGFYSAEDADSLPPEQAGVAGAHKSEGAFYIWSDEEIGSLLGDDAAIARIRFGIEPGGNAPAGSPGRVHRQEPALHGAVDRRRRRPDRPRAPTTWSPRSGAFAQTLFAARERRPRPHLDDKILTAWNGLMIAAFARAARVLVDRPRLGGVSRGGHPCGALHQDHALERRSPASALPGRRRGNRRLRRGLRVPDLGTARALSGRRQCRVARLGVEPAAHAGRHVLGPGRRRLVQHHRGRTRPCSFV